MNEDIARGAARDSFLHSSIRAANPNHLAAAIVHLKSSTMTGLAVNTHLRVMRGSRFQRELRVRLGIHEVRPLGISEGYKGPTLKILGHEVNLAFTVERPRRFPGT